MKAIEFSSKYNKCTCAWGKWCLMSRTSSKFCAQVFASPSYSSCFGILFEERVQQKRFQGIIHGEVNHLCWKLDNNSWRTSVLCTANQVSKAVKSVPSHHLGTGYSAAWQKWPANDNWGKEKKLVFKRVGVLSSSAIDVDLRSVQISPQQRQTKHDL